MAVLTMANDNNKDGEKPPFHDFLGMSCALDSPLIQIPNKQTSGFISGERETGRPSEATATATATASASFGASSGGLHGPVSVTSDLGSERQMANHFEGVPVHGLGGDFPGPEISNRFPGRKRSNSDALLMGMSRDRMLPIGAESFENSHLMKILRGSAGGERPRRSHDEEFFFGMQPPKQASTSQLILQPPVGSRPDSMASKWEQSVLMNTGPSVQYPPRMGQFTTYVDKVSSNRYRDSNAGPSVISQPAADEGSRTGIKGSGILGGINASSGTTERNPSGVLLSCSRPKSSTQNANPESSNLLRQGLTSASRQMTIFYGGQAHVFDEVHPNKADVIMALAGSNGGSWSTTYSPKSSVRPSLEEASVPNVEKGMGISSVTLPKDLRGRLPIPGSSSHGFSQGGLSTTINDPSNLSFGEHQASMTARHSRPLTHVAEPNTDGRREPK